METIFIKNKETGVMRQYVGFAYTVIDSVAGYLGIDNDEVVFFYADERGIVKDYLTTHEVKIEELPITMETDAVEFMNWSQKINGMPSTNYTELYNLFRISKEK